MRFFKHYRSHADLRSNLAHLNVITRLMHEEGIQNVLHNFLNCSFPHEADHILEKALLKMKEEPKNTRGIAMAALREVEGVMEEKNNNYNTAGKSQTSSTNSRRENVENLSEVRLSL